MSFNVEKLKQVAEPVSSDALREAEFRRENRDWLRKSAKLALAVRREMRLRNMSQQELAKKMRVSPQYVGRVLKGKENLTLETVCNIERALGVELIAVNREDTALVQIPSVYFVRYSDCQKSADSGWIVGPQGSRNSVKKES